MKLSRVEEMKLEIRNQKEEMIEIRIASMIKKFLENPGGYPDISAILKELADLREGYLMISYLRSSIVTESHGFHFGFYAEEPYVEADPDYVILKFPLLFEETVKDMEVIGRLLRKKFIRIFSSELEEIRRDYLLSIYAESGRVFEKMLKTDDKEGKQKVYYGEYMGESIIQIGII